MLYTVENLKTGIAGETHEYTDMYPGMAKTAREEGFGEITQLRFQTLGIAAVYILEIEKSKDCVDIFSITNFQQLRLTADQKD